MNEAQVRSFWNAHPCGDHQVGGLHEAHRGDYRTFFERYDAFRYRKEPHILTGLDQLGCAGKRLLEIGLGQGADSQQLIHRGAIWSGVDLTAESVQRVRVRLELFDLPHEALVQASALHLPFEDARFDIVFSHGVLHHIPSIDGAVREIARVLKPDGRLIVMLYAKRSLNYLVAIAVVRRVGLLLAHLLHIGGDGLVARHLQQARAMGMRRYLRLDNFVHRNTDGPDNPYSKVYDLAAVREDFPQFVIEKAYQCFMHAPPLPVGRLPLARWLGWHLWVQMRLRP